MQFYKFYLQWKAIKDFKINKYLHLGLDALFLPANLNK